MSEPLRRDPRAKSLVLHVNSLLTAVGYIAYPLLVILLAATGSPLLVRAVAIPAAAFVAVSLLRRVLDAPRPYEKDGIDPIIYKDTKGRSFPSSASRTLGLSGDSDTCGDGGAVALRCGGRFFDTVF